MPEIEFRTGVADKIGYACRWLRKAADRGAGVHVCGDRADLLMLDRELWVFEERSFVPHVLLNEAPPENRLLDFTPIWLGELSWLPKLPASLSPKLLLNLGSMPPAQADHLSAYARVVELVGTDADETVAGRQRWRAYLALGLNPQHLKEEAA